MFNRGRDFAVSSQYPVGASSGRRVKLGRLWHSSWAADGFTADWKQEERSVNAGYWPWQADDNLDVEEDDKGKKASKPGTFGRNAWLGAGAALGAAAIYGGIELYRYFRRKSSNEAPGGYSID